MAKLNKIIKRFTNHFLLKPKIKTNRYLLTACENYYSRHSYLQYPVSSRSADKLALEVSPADTHPLSFDLLSTLTEDLCVFVL